MEKPTVKAYSLKELYVLYNVSRHVFNSWLSLFDKKVGKVKGKTYTPRQVRIIFEFLETPEIYKAQTIKQICLLYNVSKSVYFSWIKIFRLKIGVIKGKTYYPKQVRIIIEHLDMPEIFE